MKFGVVVFPGSNCDHDCFYALKHVFGQDVRFIWHKEKDLGDVDAVILPGGFSYGDYLRTGAIAKFSPVMDAVVDFANHSGTVMGICNGFQILCEVGLLPGALMRNQSLRFVCRFCHLRVESEKTLFTSQCKSHQILNIPVAHADGLFYASDETLVQLNKHEQVVFRYCDRGGKVTEQSNPNGSLENIAGIRNRAGNVMGMMPHPDRCFETLLTSVDGAPIFESIIKNGVIN